MDVDLPPGGSNSTGHMSTIGYNSGVMHHSTSTPAGVDSAGGHSRTPPTTPKKGGKMLAIRVQMLDDTISMFQVQSKALGKVLFEQVCRQLHLLEADYFGLEYQESNGTKYWLDLEKPISRQVGLSLVDPMLRFCVKFYTPDPARLEEEFTRYLFCLQVKRDLQYGSVQCNENTAALMASYIVQAECGDFVPEDYPDHSYLSGYKFFPKQDADLEHRIMENHKKHVGQSPAEADMNLLETARRCELYGMKMHPAKDHEGVALNLAVAHLGIVIFQNFTKINTFSWAKVRKISFKRKRFLIKLHPEGYGYYKDIVEFFFETRNECKSFWKKCVENHGFFRCSSVKRVARQRTRVLSRGSSFRYSGKTQKQIVEFVRDNYVKRQNFQRCSSLSVPRSLRASRAALWTSGERSINTSVSAHPLLPLPPGSDAISVEWDKQPHYLEASLMMKGYTEEEAREVALGTRRRSEGQTTHPSEIATTYAAMKDKVYDMVTRAEVNHPPMEDSSLQQTTTPLASPESMWSQSSFQTSTTAAISTAADHRPQPPALDTTTPDGASMRGDEDSTCGSITLSATSPTQASDPTSLPLVTSTTKQNMSEESSCNGLDKTLQSHQNTEVEYATFTKKHIDGDVTVKRGVGDSSHSIDVLSGGESDADTLRKTNNNNTLHRTVGVGGRRSAYFAAKELLMTERTYRKDLELVTLWWCGEVSRRAESGLLCCEAAGALGRPCLALEDVSLAQAQLLHDVDAALAAVDHHTQDLDYTAEQQVGEILAEHLKENCETYARLVGEAGELAARVEAARRRWRPAAEACAGIEADRRTPLPMHVYLLRPLHRLVYYRQALLRLRSLEADAPLKEAEWEMLERLVSAAQEQLSHAENHAVLCQLQRDITGHDTLLVAGRQFVRLGCLLKHSAHGTQQRMCFLFSDLLLYGAKGSGAMQFRVSGQFPLHTLRMDMDTQQDTFTLHSEERSVTFSAPNVSEYSAWCHDLTHSLATASTQDYTPTPTSTVTSTEDIYDAMQDGNVSATTAVHYGNSLLHVCWHRTTTLSRVQLHQAMACQLSGYLLRKFKNSHGWQKLWVELGAFCLYFYKSWTDTEPLASLPLLGYRVCLPSAQDAIHKDFVMKLLFKNHVYFFRAESHYTFQRWMEVISIASAQCEVGDRVP